MKWLLFLLIIVAYFFANYYLFIKIWTLIPNGYVTVRVIYSIVFGLLVCSFFIGMFCESILPIPFVSFLQSLGTTYLYFLIYAVIILLLTDLIWLLNKWLHFFPTFLTVNRYSINLIIMLLIFIFIILLFIYGNWKFNHPSVIRLNIKTDKQIKKHQRIVVASDLHIGYTIGAKKLTDFVNIINQQQPDMVLLCGDIFDRSSRPVKAMDASSILKQINAPMGTYAVVGNHEYYGNLLEFIKLLKEANIIVLQDSIATVDDIVLVGRDDVSNSKRQTLNQLTSNIDLSKIVIVLDHQPVNLSDAQNSKVDFQFSGHTHDGQIFPLNLITRSIYELSHGHLFKYPTHYYVSSGLGIWGATYRIGTQSEIVVISID